MCLKIKQEEETKAIAEEERLKELQRQERLKEKEERLKEQRRLVYYEKMAQVRQRKLDEQESKKNINDGRQIKRRRSGISRHSKGRGSKGVKNSPNVIILN